MMSSPIKIISPALLNDAYTSAWFTMRNQDEVNPDRPIPGLNLGLNTDEAASVVLKNRQQLLKELKLNEGQIAYATQVHKTHVAVVEEAGIYDGTDAMVSCTQGMALAIQVADCAAILMADSENQVIGAAHAGWRGAVEGIIPKTIQKMISLGAKADRIKAFISPCISLENFEVGDEVAERFPEKFVDRTNYSKAHVDLKEFINESLLLAGLDGTSIETDSHCTLENPDFYSYRRQQLKSGRMMGIIQLK